MVIVVVVIVVMDAAASLTLDVLFHRNVYTTVVLDGFKVLLWGFLNDRQRHVAVRHNSEILEIRYLWGKLFQKTPTLFSAGGNFTPSQIIKSDKAE